MDLKKRADLQLLDGRSILKTVIKEGQLNSEWDTKALPSQASILAKIINCGCKMQD
jgi:hypothetical protein